MRRTRLAGLLLLLVCPLAMVGQKVDESLSRLVVLEKTADATLAINSRTAKTVEVRLRILDAKNNSRAEVVQRVALRPGSHNYKLMMPTGDLVNKEAGELAWYRLEYRVGDSAGLISLSELMKDDFDLRAAAVERVVPGQTFLARVRSLNPVSESAVKDVAIKVELVLSAAGRKDGLKLTGTGKTASNGLAEISLKIPSDLQLDDDDPKITITGQKNGVIRTIDEELNNNLAADAVYMTADKPLYQPGQTFNLRALEFDPSNTVVTGSELEFTVEDEDDTVVYRQKVKTSDFGIASITWPIPENSKLGEYTVHVEGDRDLQQDRMTFKVSRYDLPNFAVKASADKTYYLASDRTANVTVSGDYLFGKPVPNGKVRVVEESDRHWNYKLQKYDVDEGQTVEGVADATGKFVAKLDLADNADDLNDSEWKRYKDISFAAYVTDPSTNRTEQRRFDIRLTKNPIHIYLAYDRDHRTDLPFPVYVSTFYADGTPATCSVDIDDEHGNIARVTTNKLGASKVTLHPPRTLSESSYKIRIAARDRQGRQGTYDDSLYLTDSDAVEITTDKTIYKPGEMIEAEVISNRQNDLVYVDIAKDWLPIDQHTVRLNNGKAHISIPYRPEFKGDLAIAAYGDKESGRYSYTMHDSHGIIFPEQQNLILDAKFSKDEYHPAENALLKFSVRDGSHQPIESAIGLSIFDKAIEERARTDSDFGGYFGRFYGLMGYGRSYGGLTVKDLNDIDLSQPISDDMQLAAEMILADEWYYPAIYHSGENEKDAGELYAPILKEQLRPLDDVLKAAEHRDHVHPTDPESLSSILRQRGIDFSNLRDPWGSNYFVVFSIDRTFDVMVLKSAGPDKTVGTADDFILLSESFNYFAETEAAIQSVAELYHERTGGYVRDLPTLTAELRQHGVDLSKLKDKWDHEYRIGFGVLGRRYVITVTSDGPNGIYQPSGYSSDDFVAARSTIDYFAPSELLINQALDAAVNKNHGAFPRTADDFKATLATAGVDIGNIKDGYGRSAYLVAAKTSRYTDKVIITSDGKTKLTPVTEEVMVFRLLGADADGDNSKGQELATFSGVITEAYKGTGFQSVEVKTVPFSGALGAIKGIVADMNGAVITGATVTATDSPDAKMTYTSKTSSEGTFLIGNIPAGSYSITIDASGFKRTVLTNVVVRTQNATEIQAVLQVGTVSEVVNVTAGGVENNYTLNTSSSTVSGRQVANLPLNGNRVTVASPATSTPRLREYFPETLFWQPELVTDKRGRAEATFKMADNITTWKMFAIASTKKGKVGVVEKEVRSFQPFFVDLDPPKFLTEGDEIYLPTQVRNYTDRKQSVDVSMDQAAWFTSVSPLKTNLSVEAGASNNVVFGFKASHSVDAGKERVTAIARSDSDAIEKAVIVRPNGEEIVRPESRIFSNSTTFDLNFPREALPDTRRAELKIYPNLFSHVSESVEGLLERPYGCGEQTISSTYPDLMILKFIKSDTPLTQKARKYLAKGYERLVGYQAADGGFTYWGGKSEPDVALTAYAIRFLNDAKGTVDVDQSAIDKAAAWLISQQHSDGRWGNKYTWETTESADKRSQLVTSYVARSLAITKTSPVSAAASTKAFAYLKARNAEIDEPYAMALYGLASLESGDAAAAKSVAATLKTMAIPEGSSVYWKLETNTPFYGWGTAGRIETTALVVKLLVDTGDTPTGDTVAAKGLQFLLKSKDRYGVWYSTQATINVLDSFLDVIAREPQSGASDINVVVNGTALPAINVSADQVTPISISLTDKLAADTNKIEIRGSSSVMMAQLVGRHYVDWANSTSAKMDVNDSRAIKLDYKCDKLQPAVMEDVTCAVDAERVGFRGYGMLLAEIGIPPGAEVSRESLEAATRDWRVSHYDILPDRIILYMWAEPGGTHLKFKFHERYRVNAQTPPSVVYDYYNPDARALVKPLRFATR